MYKQGRLTACKICYAFEEWGFYLVYVLFSVHNLNFKIIFDLMYDLFNILSEAPLSLLHRFSSATTTAHSHTPLAPACTANHPTMPPLHRRDISTNP